jgi:3-methyladenine DNA glycosylase AlkD
MLNEIRDQLSRLANPADAQFLQGFFKTGPGEYGEGDRFRGIRVPALRKVAAAFQALPRDQAEELLHSPYHEDRLVALCILARQFAKADAAGRTAIYDLYLNNTRFINNWDLVDASAEHIVGAYLWDKSRKPLARLTRSSSLWERRIAMLATFHFIRRGEFTDTLRIAEILLGDKEDLIHKAVGWLLREVGKRDQATEEAFLRTHCRQMPRTMLRYAIERFPEELRQRYLHFPHR